MAKAGILNEYLLGIYIQELFYFFKESFKDLYTGVTINGETLKGLNVFYGTPQAGFRDAMRRFNGQIVLPHMNFYAFDFERMLDRERPVFYFDPTSFDPSDNTIAYTRCPATVRVSFSFNLWTRAEKETGYIMHRLWNMFPMGELTLQHHPGYDPIEWEKQRKLDPTFIPPELDPTNRLLIPTKLSESVSNETEIEGLGQNEVKDKHKTVFTLTAECKIPYKIQIARTIQNILVGVTTVEDDPNNTLNDTLDEYSFIMPTP